MLTIQEHQTIFQLIVSIMLPVIVVSHLQSKLPNQQYMAHNTMIQEWQLFIQPIIWLLKFQAQLPHSQISTHNLETIGRQLIKMLITQEHLMISQLIASTMLLDIVELLHLNKLLSQQFTDLNIMTPEWQQYTQPITWLHKFLPRQMQLLSLISIHGLEITGKPLIKMQITLEPPMTFQLIAFIMLPATVVLHPRNKLPNQQYMDLNIMTQVWQQYTQLTICWPKDQQLPQSLDMYLTNIQALKVLTWHLLSTALILMREWLYWMEWQKQFHIHSQVTTAMLITDCELEKIIEKNTCTLIDKNNTLYLIF